MNAGDLAVGVLLGIGVAAQLLCCVGVLVMRSAFDRLHYTAAATTVGPFCIGTAVVIREWLTAAGIETIVTVLLLFLLSPVLVTATARAARRIEFGGLEPRPAERERGR